MPVFTQAVVVSQPAPPSTEQQADVIEVVGTRAAQGLKIDRRSYVVQSNPSTAQKSSLQLLRGLPAVSIGTDDTISLLGSGATVTVDGQTYSGDLKTIHGSDIEKIEIITNPSAQYSAQGTGGIINLVLRKKRSEGISGNYSIEGGSLGWLNLNGTIKRKRGKTRLELSPFFRSGIYQRSRTEKLRSVEPDGLASVIRNSESIVGTGRQSVAGTSATIAHDFSDWTGVSLDLFGGGLNSESTTHSDLKALTPGFASYSQDQQSRQRFRFIGTNLSYNHKGKREGEMLTSSLGAFGNPVAGGTTTTETSDGRRLSTATPNSSRFINAKIDWTHPIGERRILSLGGEANDQSQHSQYRLDIAGGGTTPYSFSDEFHGQVSTVAAYTTFQQRLGTWTILPGLRVETNRRSIASPRFTTFRTAHTDLFPSLHVEHTLGKYWVATLSRGSRIDRVGVDLLRPYAIQRDLLLLDYGNSALRDARTSSYETNVHYHRKKIDAGLIVYDRETTDVLGGRYTVNAAGQNVYFPINAGHRRDRGAEFDVSLPLLARTKAQWSLNLFDSRVPIDITSGATLDTLRKTSKLTLEYDAPERKGVPGDVVQLMWNYEGRQVDYQVRRRPWHQLTLTATHNLNRKWALTATADSGPLGSGTMLEAPSVQEVVRNYYRAELKVKIMRTFGRP